jgi:hypothetical protein
MLNLRALAVLALYSLLFCPQLIFAVSPTSMKPQEQLVAQEEDGKAAKKVQFKSDEELAEGYFFDSEKPVLVNGKPAFESNEGNPVQFEHREESLRGNKVISKNKMISKEENQQALESQLRRFYSEMQTITSVPSRNPVRQQQVSNSELVLMLVGVTAPVVIIGAAIWLKHKLLNQKQDKLVALELQNLINPKAAPISNNLN